MVSVFATVILRRHPSAWIFLAAVATGVAVSLVIGGWHFAGDAIAGAWGAVFMMGLLTPITCVYRRLDKLYEAKR